MNQPIKLSKITPKPRVIDATPTFEGAVHMCLLLLESGDKEGRDAARDELLRYGRELDRLSAQTGTAFDPSDTPIEGE